MAVISTFVGQSIPFRNSRRSQKLLLQVCILMAFFIRSAYESLIISSMAASREGIRFKSIDEIFQSNMSFRVDGIFLNIFNKSNEFSSLISRMKKMSEKDNTSAIILRCDVLEHEFHTVANVSKNYYLLPGQLMSIYDKIPLAFKSPFYEKFQKEFDHIFESGLRQH
ncbi:CLUMA_CG001901, isoform A [Clunio marinus]|uniref:CLUMA_CG001901, isoform A n=1 Tax=Clunio marinus TaxID=568069 RepID=A0A1J1HL35_9DIPT|nr:CLUMA_CG001901, isoform A [Clunio marinus]